VDTRNTAPHAELDARRRPRGGGTRLGTPTSRDRRRRTAGNGKTPQNAPRGGARMVPIFPALERELIDVLERELAAAQLTGHSLAVWTRNCVRSFGKAHRDEARARMLQHGFGAPELELDDEASRFAATALPPEPFSPATSAGVDGNPCKWRRERRD